MNVLEMIKAQLKQMGCDGLWNENGPCGCAVEGWEDGGPPCGSDFPIECVSARKGPPGEDADGQYCDYLMCPVKDGYEHV
jgi:hypothetical protein